MRPQSVRKTILNLLVRQQASAHTSAHCIPFGGRGIGVDVLRRRAAENITFLNDDFSAAGLLSQ